MSSIEFINLFATETKRNTIKDYIILGNTYAIEKFIGSERENKEQMKQAFERLKPLINPQHFKQHLNDQQKQEVERLEKNQRWDELRDYIGRKGSLSAIRHHKQWEANRLINPPFPSNLTAPSGPAIVGHPIFPQHTNQPVRQLDNGIRKTTQTNQINSRPPKTTDREWCFPKHPSSKFNLTQPTNHTTSQPKQPKKSDKEWCFQVPSNLAGLIIGKNGQYVKKYKELERVNASVERGVPGVIKVRIDGWDASFAKIHQVCMDFLLRIGKNYSYAKLIPFYPMSPFQQLLFMEDNCVIIEVLNNQRYRMYSFDASCLQNAESIWNSNQRFRQSGPLQAVSFAVSEESIPEIVPKPPPRNTSKRSKKIYNKNNFQKPAFGFSQPDTGSLESNLKQETCILLLGQSGVGKSTFLNAFANYLEFGRNFEKAEKNLRVLIKAQYELSYHDDRDPETVELTPPGDEDGENEKLGGGQSSTQEARCYTINYKAKTGTKTIKIIDTPGLLDTRGIEMDQLNIARILKCLQKFKTIQAIVFLLKPDETRNAAPLIYNLNELLSRLHKKAADNILFCFPRSDWKQHNDTVVTLRKFFESISSKCGVRIEMQPKENIFRVDNQGFLYLGGQKYGNFNLQGEERKTAKERWICSATDIEKMLNKIATLPDYEVQKTLQIADTKNWLKALSKPMADFSLQILGHQGKLAHLEDELKHLALECKSLEEKHTYQQTNYVRIPTEQRMVCFSERCAIPVGNDHIPSECHKDCNCITEMTEEAGKELLNCSAFVDKIQGICSICKCPFTAHRRINYRLETKVVQIKNTKATDANINEHQKIAAKIKEAKEEIEANSLSLKLLQQNGALFAAFIAQESIVSENDGFSDYLNQCLQLARYNHDEIQCERLERFKKEYDQEKTLYSPDTHEKVSYEDVLKKLEELKKDKNIGDLLTKLQKELGMGDEETVAEEKVIIINALFNKIRL